MAPLIKAFFSLPGAVSKEDEDCDEKEEDRDQDETPMVGAC
jgi:hypothetical protein